MSDNTDLKKLWGQQETPAPDSKVIFEKTRKFRRSNLLKILRTNILLILTSAFIIYIWFNYQPEMITTRIGIILTVLAMVVFLIGYNQMIPMLMKVEYGIDNNQYLQQLLRIKAKQLFLHGTMLNIYFIMLTAGICIYMIEFVARMTILSGILTYGITLAWVTVNWFVFRPKTTKKQEAKINELIGEVERVSGQLGGE